MADTNTPQDNKGKGKAGDDNEFPISLDALRIVLDKTRTAKAAANFAQVNRLTHSLSKNLAWDLDIQTQGVPVLFRALNDGDVDLFARAISHYKQRGWNGLLDGSSVNWDSFFPKDKRGLLVRDPHIYALSFWTPPIILAVEARQPEMLRMLIEAGVPLDSIRTVPPDERYRDAQDTFDFLPPDSGSHPRCVCRYHDSSEWDFSWDSTYTCRETALHQAVALYDTQMTRMLIEAGAAGAREFTGNKSIIVYDRPPVEAGHVPPPLLHRAIGTCPVRYDEIQSAGDPSQRDKERLYDMVDLLLKQGANPNEFFGSRSQSSVVAYAVWEGFDDVAKLLIENGAVGFLPPELEGPEYWCPLSPVKHAFAFWEKRPYFYQPNGPSKTIAMLDLLLYGGGQQPSQQLIQELLDEALELAEWPLLNRIILWKRPDPPSDTPTAIFVYLLEKGARFEPPLGKLHGNLIFSIWCSWHPAQYAKKLQELGYNRKEHDMDTIVKIAERDIELTLKKNKELKGKKLQYDVRGNARYELLKKLKKEFGLSGISLARPNGLAQFAEYPSSDDADSEGWYTDEDSSNEDNVEGQEQSDGEGSSENPHGEESSDQDDIE